MNKKAMIFYEQNNWMGFLNCLPGIAVRVLACINTGAKYNGEIAKCIFENPDTISVYLKRLSNAGVLGRVGLGYTINDLSLAVYLEQSKIKLIDKRMAEVKVYNRVFDECSKILESLEKAGLISNTAISHAAEIASYAKASVLRDWKDV